MNQLIRKVQVFLSVYYAHMVEYRAELFLWALSGTLPLILMGVWIKASQNGQFGLKPEDFARYFLTVFFVRQFNVVWVAWEFEKEVVKGGFPLGFYNPSIQCGTMSQCTCLKGWLVCLLRYSW